jgi:hypothetical protein
MEKTATFPPLTGGEISPPPLPGEVRTPGEKDKRYPVPAPQGVGAVRPRSEKCGILEKACASLERALGRVPRADEMAGAVGMSLRE